MTREVNDFFVLVVLFALIVVIVSSCAAFTVSRLDDCKRGYTYVVNDQTGEMMLAPIIKPELCTPVAPTGETPAP